MSTYTNKPQSGAKRLTPIAIAAAAAAAAMATPVAHAMSVGLLNTGNTPSVTVVGTISGVSLGVSNNGGSIGVLTNPASGVISAAVTGVENTGTIGTLSNAGSISSGIGVHNDARGTIGLLINNSGASISGGSTGVNNAGTIGALTNNGTISGGFTGVNNQGSIGALTNNGVIHGGGGGLYSGNGGVIATLTNNGTIVGDSISGVNVYGGTIGTLANHGLIQDNSHFSGGSAINGGAVWNDGNGLIGVLSNSGTIVGNLRGVYNTGGATIGTLNNSGSISGSTAGIYNTGATISSLVNSGSITSGKTGIDNRGFIGTVANNGVIAGGVSAIWNNGTIGTLTNSGSITSGKTGVDNQGFIGTVANTGVITGGASGIWNNGTIGTLVNSGTISSTSSGGVDNAGTLAVLVNTAAGRIAGGSAIYNSGTIGALSNQGVIQGRTTGITNYRSIGTLTNSGTIAGGAVLNLGYTPAAIANVGGSISQLGALVNSGLIDGGLATGLLNTGSIGTVTNTGTITGGLNALQNGAAGTLGTIGNAGVIAGGITNLSSRDLNINGGTGTTFGTLTGLGGTVGAITSTASNVVFGSGNLVLNDSINVGSNAVINNASTLQVNAPMTITGNYNQGANATLLVGAGTGAVTNGALADTGYGRLIVSGSAAIAAGSAIGLTSQGYVFAAGQRYVVVDASSSGTNYNEATLNYGIRGYNAVLSGANVTAGGRSDLVVTVVSATPIVSSTPAPSPAPTPAPAPAPTTPATVPNAISALTGLSHYTGINDAALLNLYNAGQALNVGSSDAANRAGTQLSPVQHVSATGGAAAAILDVLNIANARTDGLRLGQLEGTGIATGEGTQDWGVWGQAFGGHASQNTRNQVDGYRANYGGLMIGTDRAIGDAWRAGGVFSYSNTLINGRDNASGDSTRVNAYGLTGYASYTGAPWYVNVSGGVVQQHYDTNREIGFTGFSGIAKGSFSGQQYVARAEGGYPLAMGKATITPLASLTYSHLNQNDYTETGGNGAALVVGSTHATSVRSGLGVKLEQGFETSYGKLVPQVQLTWVHEFNRNPAVTGASFAADPSGQTAFTTVGATPVANLADLTLGVTLLRANNLSLSARYELQAGQGFVSHTGSLRLRQLF